MGKLIRFRPPRIRISAKGVKIVKPSARVGGKNVGVNVSSKGVSTSAGVRGATYNTRRGCLLSPFTWLGMLFRRR